MRKGKCGLTLMEVIISALLLSITVGGMLHLFSTEKIVVSRTGREIQAMDFARQTLEELKNEVGADTWDVGFLSTGTHSSTTSSADADFLLIGTCDFRDKFDGVRSYTVSDAPQPDSYREVTVTVDWTKP